ncbi:MAG TPA: heavy-metal-associated domain-containing protein [Sphingomicrobium sp.]|nr:heavy-metal-associated domain-containing protein [Sphingomicrobium sp.]
MARCPLLFSLALLLVLLGISGSLYAQMESGERGIAPLESAGTLEVTGIHVDVGAKDAQSARFAGWRIAQRQGFRALWASINKRPVAQAPNLPDSTLDGLVSSIIVNKEQIGPNRYIADLGILFDRARSAQLLGVGGEVRRTVPMLLIPITVTAGSATSVEWRNAWQRAWAEFRTAQSPIDYVRISGVSVDPLLVNAAQVRRPGRGWWRNIIDLYGAADILVAEVMVHRLFPGGPAEAKFIGRHGPDGDIVGGFTLRATDSADMARMMREGVARMDQLFTRAHAAGAMQRDPTLNIPEPPPIIEDVEDETTAYQVLIYSPDATTYNFAFATLKVMPGVQSVNPVNINIGGVSRASATIRGDAGPARSAMAARGWTVTVSGGTIRISNGPFRESPSAPAPAPAQPQQPTPTGNSGGAPPGAVP